MQDDPQIGCWIVEPLGRKLVPKRRAGEFAHREFEDGGAMAMTLTVIAVVSDGRCFREESRSRRNHLFNYTVIDHLTGCVLAVANCSSCAEQIHSSARGRRHRRWHPPEQRRSAFETVPGKGTRAVSQIIEPWDAHR